MTGETTANYKIIADEGGNRYRFFCDASGIAVYITKPVRADTPAEERKLAWEQEAKKYFNYCSSCGKWICDTMYNADMLKCVDCAPWQKKPNYCAQCGRKIPKADRFCRACGVKLRYGEAVI